MSLWSSLVRRLFRGKPADVDFLRRTNRRSRPPEQRVQLAVERLEDRLAPAVASSLTANVLTVTESAANDHAYLRVNGGNIDVANNSSFTGATSYTATNVHAIAINDTGGSHSGQAASMIGSAGFSLSSTFTTSGIESLDVDQAISASSVSGDATAVNVTPGTGNAGGTIQNGIDLSASGASIFVAAGTYTVGAAVNVNNTEIVSDGGSSAVSITVSGGGLNFSTSGSQYNINLNSTSSYDQLTATGGGSTIALGGNVTLGLSMGSSVYLNDTYTILTAPSVTGQFTNGTSISSGGYTFGIAYNSGTVVLTCTAVPTSSTVYVNDNWTNTTAGADADGSGALSAIYGRTAFNSIATGLSELSSGGTLYVEGGSYSSAFTAGSGVGSIHVIHDTDNRVHPSHSHRYRRRHAQCQHHHRAG